MAKERLNPKEVFFITEIAKGEGGAEQLVDIEGFYDVDSAAERLDFRAKELFNHLVKEVEAQFDPYLEDAMDEHGWTRDDYVQSLESAQSLINKGEYQEAINIMSDMIRLVMSQELWITELLHAEKVK